MLPPLKYTLPLLLLVTMAFVGLANSEPLRGGLREKPRPTENTAAIEDVEQQNMNNHPREVRQVAPRRKALPAGWKLAVNPFENVTDADLLPPPSPKAKVSASRIKAKFDLRNGGNGTEEMEKVRGLLAQYRQKAADKRSKAEKAAAKGAKGKGEEVEVSDKLKKQMRMRAAEQKAAVAKGYQRPLSIAEINEPVSDDLFGGDMMLTAEQAQAMIQIIDSDDEDNNSEGGNKTSRVKRSMMNFAYYVNSKWDKSQTIYYSFDSTITPTLKTQIKKAIDTYYQKTCFYLAETTPTDTTRSQPIILFTKASTGCFATLGRVMNAVTQTVNIGTNCETIGTIEHEIGHALGFFHSAQRHDRNSSITVNMNNVQTGKKDNFLELTTTQNNNQGVGYDYGSVMQYSADAFPVNPAIPTIVAKEAHMQNTMGQRQRLSFTDLKILNTAYQCTQCTAAQNANCKNGGVPNPNWCDQCICPTGFGGADCSARQASTANANCGGTLQSTYDWQDLNGAINVNLANSNYNAYETCHWLITSPPNTYVWFWIQEVSGDNCDVGCATSNVEVKVNNFGRAGYRMCCQSDIPTDDAFVIGGYTNQSIISLSSRAGSQTFKIAYGWDY